MYYQFLSIAPNDVSLDMIKVLSADEFIEFGCNEFLFYESDNNTTYVFRINFEYHCSPFKQVLSIDNILAVGHENNFYLFDLEKNKPISTIATEGYFGHMYIHEEYFYVADAYGIKCVNLLGEIIWSNDNLAIDGVVINSFEDGKILGSGEWDPPGGWREFILSIKSGKLIS